MATTFDDLKKEAEAKAQEGNLLEALEKYQIILEHIPLDFELRLEIGDGLESLGYKDHAMAVFETVAKHDIKSGNPLRAMAATKRISALNGDPSSIVRALAKIYSFGSEVIGRGIKPAPVDYDVKIPKKAKLDREWEKEDLIAQVAKSASSLGSDEEYPAIVPPVALFSQLLEDAFLKLMEKLDLSKFSAGEAVVHQGDPGDSIYFIARGEVSVVRATSEPEGEEETALLARLGPGSLFGEMALVSTEPRSASVICDSNVDVLELKQASIEKLAGEIKQIADAMARFTRERMIANLFATNPIFKHFDEDSQKKLLARFTGHEVPKGTIFLEQATVGQGLYIILRGKAEVLKWEEDEYTKVADLGPGDIAGEISLLYEEPITATVRTTTKATLLFLARELFAPIVEAIPELLVYFNKLASERTADTEFKLMQKKVVDDDYVEEIEDLGEVSMDDAVFI